MPEPIAMPGAETPVVSGANIKGSPITTIAAVLAAVAQYLAVNGADLPQGTQGWVSFGVGLAIAIAGALIRDPKMLKSITPVLALAVSLSLLTACKPGDVTPTGPSAAVVSSLVAGATGLACGAIPVEDRPAVSLGLTAFLSVLNTDPVTAMIQVSDPVNPINANLGMGWVWAKIHAVLDPLGAAGWSVYSVQLMRGAVTACLRAIDG